MKRIHIRMMAVLAAGALGACGDSTGVVELSEAEAAALAEAVVQAAFVATANGGGPALVGGPAAAPYAYDVNVSFTADCPLGGSVAVDGSADISGDDATGEGRIELSVTHDHAGCVVESEDGTQFTFDGAPNLTLDFVLETDGQGELGWTGTIEGAVDWATGEREGRCPIALGFSGLISQADQALEVSIEGAVCSRAVVHSWSLTAGTT